MINLISPVPQFLIKDCGVGENKTIMKTQELEKIAKTELEKRVESDTEKAINVHKGIMEVINKSIK